MFAKPMDILSIVISLFAFLFAITIHEASHAWTASRFGDPTAAAMGRVSLNPLAHIDPFGTVLLPLILVAIGAPAFGWAKPVMVNPRNLKHPRRDNLWISLSGPAANLTAAAASLALILLMKALNPGTSAFLRNFLIERQHFPRGFFPLEGLALILFYAVLVNTYLAVFNLIPVPPLDGSGVLAGVLSDQAAAKYDRLRPYGFFIVVALISVGVLDIIIRPLQIVILTLVFF
jgi:Zn-dependent protease